MAMLAPDERVNLKQFLVDHFSLSELQDLVFNMGIGLVFVVSPYYAENIQQRLASGGYPSWAIGRVTEGDGEVTWA